MYVLLESSLDNKMIIIGLKVHDGSPHAASWANKFRVVEYSPKKAITKKTINNDNLHFTLIAALIFIVVSQIPETIMIDLEWPSYNDNQRRYTGQW